MAKFTWVGKSPEDFGGWTADRIDKAVESLKREVDDATTEGKDLVRRNLDAATTKTGESGHPSGRASAGRNVTGNMIQKVSNGKEENGDTYTGYFGWTAADMEVYFFTQELGGSPSAVPAAHALRDAFFEESQRAEARMNRIWRRQ